MVSYVVGFYFQQPDYEALAMANMDRGVHTGLSVTTTSSMNVTVGAGYIIYDDRISVSETVVPVPTSNPTYPRKDIIYVTTAGVISITTGAAIAVYPAGTLTGVYVPIPRPPNLPANTILLHEVWVGAGVTSISTSDIYDKRHFVSPYKFYAEPRTSDPTTNLFDGRMWVRTDL